MFKETFVKRKLNWAVSIHVPSIPSFLKGQEIDLKVFSGQRQKPIIISISAIKHVYIHCIFIPASVFYLINGG
jgi:hypothetical protein